MYSEFRVQVIDLMKKSYFSEQMFEKYFSLFLVPYLVECYFDMSHGSYDSNLGSRDIRSRSWHNIDGAYGISSVTNKQYIIQGLLTSFDIF